MRHFSVLALAWAMALLSPTLLQAQVLRQAQEQQQEGDTLYVFLKSGKVDIFPKALVADIRTDDGLVVTTNAGESFEYAADSLRETSEHAITLLPSITSFKFNNKFNDQIFEDVQCRIQGDSLITGVVGAIGRWLTPSFQLSDKAATVYIDTVRQYSKRSRVYFDDPIRYTVKAPGVRLLSEVCVSEERTVGDSIVQTPIPLTVDMLSTNAPSNRPTLEGLDKMLDDDETTYFHSTWGSGEYEKLPSDSCPYIEITLPTSVRSFQFQYSNRLDTDSRSPMEWSVQTSLDGVTWKERQHFGEEEGTTATRGAVVTSPPLTLTLGYRHIRLVMVRASDRNYLCLASLRIFSVETIKGHTIPAEYATLMAPFGRDYTVKLTWMASKVKEVPDIYIDTEDGKPISSKTVYVEGEMRIQGNNVFPDFDATPMLIKGRGNTSWSNDASSKNPYRLKFEEAVKPFGLHKGKSWVLQGNRQSGSMMANPIGMKIARLVGADGANQTIPVNLYMNDEYWGSYVFTEKVGFSNNSIDLDDETAATLLELDTYFDETYRFHSSPYLLPVNIKEPDFSDAESETTIQRTDIEAVFNEFVSAVAQGEDVSPYVDVESLARFFMVNELIENQEIMHPKSTYLYHPNIKDPESKFHFGPIWDLDYAFGYEMNGQYCVYNPENDFWTLRNMEGSTFMRDLRNAGEPLDRAIYKVWTLFRRDNLQEVLDFCDEYYDFARTSFVLNNTKRSDSKDYAVQTANAKHWLKNRVDYVYAALTPYDLTPEELDTVEEPDEPLDPNNPSVIPYDPAAGVEGQTATATSFDVYNANGVCVKRHATYRTLREGLRPGLYIVNGKKMLIR